MHVPAEIAVSSRKGNKFETAFTWKDENGNLYPVENHPQWTFRILRGPGKEVLLEATVGSGVSLHPGTVRIVLDGNVSAFAALSAGTYRYDLRAKLHENDQYPKDFVVGAFEHLAEGAGVVSRTARYDMSIGEVVAELVVQPGLPGPPGDGSGDMVASSYDPRNIAKDVFDRTSHTGEQPISTVTGLESALNARQSKSEKGQANGYADLDEAGKIPIERIPSLPASVVGLDQVNNTSDADKPVSTAQQEALNQRQNLSEKGQPNGYPSLDAGGKIPSTQIPPIAITEYLGEVESDLEMLALVGQRGDWCVRTDTKETLILSGDDPSQLSSWKAFVAPGQVVSVNGQSGTVLITKASVGLGSVQDWGPASKSEAEAGEADNKYMTPLRVKQAIEAIGASVAEPAAITDLSATPGDSQISLAFTWPEGAVLVRVLLDDSPISGAIYKGDDLPFVIGGLTNDQEYTVALRAHNQAGYTDSSAVQVTPAEPHVSASVSMSQPEDGSTLNEGAEITVAATLTENNDEVADLLFQYHDGSDWADGPVVAATTDGAHSGTWTAVAGATQLRAVARDGSSEVLATSAEIGITINHKPVVELAIPDIADIENSPNVTIDPLTYFSDPDGDDLVPSVVSGDSASVVGGVFVIDLSQPLTETVTVRATDPGGLYAEQSFDVVVYERATLTVSDHNPVEGSTIQLGVQLDDSRTASEVNFYYEGGTPVLIGSAESSPWTYAWEVEEGFFSVYVVITYEDGEETTDSIGVTVRAFVSATIALSDPSPSAVFNTGSSVNLAALLTENDHEVASIVFQYRTGSSWTTAAVAEATEDGTYERIWTAVAGADALRVQARDASNDIVATSSVVAISVNVSPMVSQTIPNVMAFAGDPDVLVDLRDYFSDDNGDALDFEITSGSSADIEEDGYTMRVSLASRVQEVVVVRASDPGTLSATQAFDVKIYDKAAIGVDNQAPEEGETVMLSVSVDPARTITEVRYYQAKDGSEFHIATIESADWSYGWMVEEGTFAVFARLVYADGEETTPTTTIVVSHVIVSAAVSMTQPAGGSAHNAGASVQLAASLSVNDDPVASILFQYFLAGQWHSAASKAASESGVYEATWEAIGGASQLRAIARSASDVPLATSDSIAVSINRAPVESQSIGDITAVAGDPNVTLDPAEYFSDPDGDEMEPSVVAGSSASVVGGQFVVNLESPVSETVTVRVADPGGLSATQSFDVLVYAKAQITVSDATPTAGDTVTLGVTLDPNRTPTGVDYYSVDEGVDTLIGSAASAPWTFAWEIEEGEFDVFARITYADGSEDTTATSITATSEPAPVEFAAPADDAVFTSVQTIPLKGHATGASEIIFYALPEEE